MSVCNAYVWVLFLASTDNHLYSTYCVSGTALKRIRFSQATPAGRCTFYKRSTETKDTQQRKLEDGKEITKHRLSDAVGFCKLQEVAFPFLSIRKNFF